ERGAAPQKVVPHLEALLNLRRQRLRVCRLTLEHRRDASRPIGRLGPRKAMEACARAHYIYAFADLRNPKLMWREAPCVDLVTKPDERGLDPLKRLTTVVLQQVRDIFENEVGRRLRVDDGGDVEEEIALPGALEAELLARLREGLAWEPRAQHIVVRH